MSQPNCLETDVAVLKNDVKHISTALEAIGKDMKAVLDWQVKKNDDSTQVRAQFKALIDNLDRNLSALTIIVTDEKTGLVSKVKTLEQDTENHFRRDKVIGTVLAGCFIFFGVYMVPILKNLSVFIEAAGKLQ